MKKNSISYIKKLKGISLSSTESHTMRENLVAYTDMHAVVSAPLITKVEISRKSPFSRFTYGRIAGAFAILFVLIGGGAGVTFASENALPGQPLYVIKVAIAEPIQGAFITSTAGKAQWQTYLADRRLAEASELASENKLATSTQVYLQNSVATHVALAEQDADTLAESGNETGALTIRTDLTAKLSAHADILILIAPQLVAVDGAASTSTVIALLQNDESDKTSAISGGDNASSTSMRVAITFTDSTTTSQYDNGSQKVKTSAALFRAIPMAGAFSSSSASTTASTTINLSPWIGKIPFHIGALLIPDGITNPNVVPEDIRGTTGQN